MIKTAMIFAAGYGKRLKPLTDVTPKPLLLINGETCLSRSIDRLKEVGILKIIINAYHLNKQIIDYCKGDPSLEVIVENDLLETGGGLINVLDKLDDKILLINGDIWYEDNTVLKEMISSFDTGLMDGLLMLVRIKHALFYEGQGDYWCKDISQKTGMTFPIQHKGTMQKIEAPYIFGGIQIWNKDFIKQNKENKPANFSMRIFFDHAEKKGRLYGMRYEKSWCDIGTHKAYEGLNKHILTIKHK